MSTNTFIRVVEYWVPSADRSILELGGGLFGSARHFESVSRQLCFGRGEGLPGQAWACGHPMVLKQLDGAYFRRAAAAKADGLTCGIAVPVFAGDDLSAVIVIFCGDDDAHAGAIELWGNQPEESTDMNLVDGYYGTTGDTFEFLSRSTSFRQGNGLPGLAWERQAPVFMEDLGRGSGFLRADSVVKVGINRGFAMPCPSHDGANYVMAFLSALATPIARCVEIWTPDASGLNLQRSMGFSETLAQRLPADAAPLPCDGASPISQAFTTCVPAVAGQMIALPVAPQGKATAVLALHL